MPGSPKPLRWQMIVIAVSFALALLLNAAYTTWALHSELQKSCSLLRAQSASQAYPAAIRRGYAALARQRGC